MDKDLQKKLNEIFVKDDTRKSFEEFYFNASSEQKRFMSMWIEGFYKQGNLAQDKDCDKVEIKDFTVRQAEEDDVSTTYLTVVAFIYIQGQKIPYSFDRPINEVISEIKASDRRGIRLINAGMTDDGETTNYILPPKLISGERIIKDDIARIKAMNPSMFDDPKKVGGGIEFPSKRELIEFAKKNLELEHDKDKNQNYHYMYGKYNVYGKYLTTKNGKDEYSFNAVVLNIIEDNNDFPSHYAKFFIDSEEKIKSYTQEEICPKITEYFCDKGMRKKEFIKKTSKEEIKRIQQTLKNDDHKIEVDGILGPKTEQAMYRYGVKHKVNGCVVPVVYNDLEEAKHLLDKITNPQSIPAESIATALPINKKGFSLS